MASPTVGRCRQDQVQDLELSAAHAAQVHRFVARRVANHADAADIAQQALMIACEKSDSFRGASASAWLLTIARNLIVDHYRARSRYRFVDVDQLAEFEPALRTAPDVAGVICDCRSRMSGWLDCITRTLRLEEQVAVLLADIYGYRDRESAAELRMSVPSFKLLLHGARGRLHKFADDRCTVVECRGARTGRPHGRFTPGSSDLPTRCPLPTRRTTDRRAKGQTVERSRRRAVDPY